MSRFWSALFGVVIAIASLVQAARAVEYAQTISRKLNTTGRAITMQVPLNDNGRTAGEVTVRISPDDAVFVDCTSLRALLAETASAQTRARLDRLASQDGFVPIETIREAGIDANFDPASQEVSIRLTADDRETRDIDLGVPRAGPASAQAQRPANVAGYLNIVAGIDYAWDGLGSEGSSNDVSGRLELESGLRVWDVVVENRVIYDGDVDTAFCPTGAICDFDHTSGLKRQSTRLTYDLPAERIRVSAGDVEPLGTGLQRRAEIAGVSVEKAPRRFNPLASGATFSSTALRIERDSDIEIRVNGALLHTMHLRSGVYNLRDLPLSTGANDVEITIIDDLGQRRTQSSRTFFDDAILAQGDSAWALAAGIPSYFIDDERNYDANGYAATAFLRYGLTGDLTGVAHAQADQNVAMAGLGFVTRTEWGVFSLDAAASAGRLGTGVAANLGWDILNINGLFAPRGENLRLRTELRSTGFHTPGEYLVDYSSIIYPEYNYWLRLEASYSLPLPYEVTASLSARYQFADPDRQSYSSYAINEDRYGADVTLARAITETSSASMTVGYSNESYLNDLRWDDRSEPEFRLALHYYWRPDDRTSISAGFDTLNRQGGVTANRQGGEPDGSWQASVELQQDPLDDRIAANGSINYQGNRGVVGVTQLSGVSTQRKARGESSDPGQRTLLRAGTSIAFADGHVAVGQPIRDGAFAIVYPHESISGNEVTVGNDDAPLASSGTLGPALVTNIPAYMPSTIPISVSDLPVGYSLGSSTIDTVAPYKAGYAIQVGSDYSISAFGTLTTETGEPAALRAGIAHPEGQEAPAIGIFTNGAGRFGAEGLGSGHWVIELEQDDGKLRYAFEVPENSTGLFKAGTLTPSAVR